MHYRSHSVPLRVKRCTHMCTFVSQNGAVRDIGLVHCGICATSLFDGCKLSCQWALSTMSVILVVETHGWVPKTARSKPKINEWLLNLQELSIIFLVVPSFCTQPNGCLPAQWVLPVSATRVTGLVDWAYYHSVILHRTLPLNASPVKQL